MIVNRISLVYFLVSVGAIKVIQCSPIEINEEPRFFDDAYTPIPILSQTEDIMPDGSFSYR